LKTCHFNTSILILQCTSTFIFSEVYYADEIQDLVVYARIRGIFVLPELDAPAHAGYGWDWGPSKGLGNLSLCVSKKGLWTDFDPNLYKNISLAAEPPSGQLNPLNENVYKVRKMKVSIKCFTIIRFSLAIFVYNN
jgi:hypothetical protein